MKRFLFVGERPSPTAHGQGWTWKSGRLAAATLFSALRAHQIHPEHCGFVNIFDDIPGYHNIFDDIPGYHLIPDKGRLAVLEAAADAGVVIVALGIKVSRALGDIPHIKLRHPAVRGRGRATAAYSSHVKDVLT